MITVEKISEEVRKEGVNLGLPTTHIKLGPGVPYSTVEELVRELIANTKCKWVYIFGEGPTQVGMGNLVAALVACSFSVEVECSGSVVTPGWVHKVDRWVVSYTVPSSFNYASLRSQDMIKFQVATETDFEVLVKGFEALKLFPGCRYVVLPQKDFDNRKSKLFLDVLQFVRKFDRARIYEL
jgi:hypothetical protein